MVRLATNAISMGLRKDKGSQEKNTTKYGENAKIPTKRAKKGAATTSTSNDQENAPTTAPIVPNASNDQEISAVPDASNDQEISAAPNELSSPTRLTKEQIIQNSPNRVTRG